MSRVTIWDMDYYYDRSSSPNPDVMRISSYHKQMGDDINFVTKEEDILRPYDEYYLVREKDSTPTPPAQFYTNRKIKWWGNAVRYQVTWKMSRAMMACRPDYLLYPRDENGELNKNQLIRLFDEKGNPLGKIQDYRNSFKGFKYTIEEDSAIWFASVENVEKALETLAECKNLSFSKAIWIDKILANKNIQTLFLKLKMTSGSNLEWTPVKIEQLPQMFEFLQRCKKAWPRVKIGTVYIKYNKQEHWNNRQEAIDDFNAMKNAIIQGKRLKVPVSPVKIIKRLDTPYFALFEELTSFMEKKPQWSWLNYITWHYAGLIGQDAAMYWSMPARWNDVFRDLLRQTWEDKDFLLTEWGDKICKDNDVPWLVFKKEFEYGI
jgi:hypothetical protein